MAYSPPAAAALPPADTGPWADARRLESWAGEVRVNLLRLVALICFYAHHLYNVWVVRDPSITPQFDAAVGLIVLAWAVEVVVLHLCLSRRWMPTGLKYIVVADDLILITALVALAGDPRSPLVLLYFLVIASASLRLSLRLVYLATLGSMLGYLFILGHYAYFIIGPDRYYGDAAVRIPRSTEIIFLLTLGAAGLFAGQTVRQARRLVLGNPVQVEPDSSVGEVH